MKTTFQLLFTLLSILSIKTYFMKFGWFVAETSDISIFNKMPKGLPELATLHKPMASLKWHVVLHICYVVR